MEKERKNDYFVVNLPSLTQRIFFYNEIIQFTKWNKTEDTSQT